LPGDVSFSYECAFAASQIDPLVALSETAANGMDRSPAQRETAGSPQLAQ
jgi:hypothetical protein